MTQELQELADKWERLSELWCGRYIDCATELREALARCNLTAEVPTWQELEAIHDKAWKEGGFGYDRAKASWEAVINALIPHIPHIPATTHDAKPSGFDEWLNQTFPQWDTPSRDAAHYAWQACKKRMQAKVEDKDEMYKIVAKECGVLKTENDALRAELETLRWRSSDIEPTEADADAGGDVIVFARGSVTTRKWGAWSDWRSSWRYWRPVSLPDPFTTWKSSYMPNSSDDLALEAWEKARGVWREGEGNGCSLERVPKR
jgi:hypothetical protein